MSPHQTPQNKLIRLFLSKHLDQAHNLNFLTAEIRNVQISQVSYYYK